MQIKINCPQCGGDIVFDEEIEVVRCQYCGSTNQISGKSGYPRYMLPPRWTEDECRQKISKVLTSNESLRLRKNGLKLVFAPYWRSRGMVFHWVLGKKQDISKVGTRSWEDAKELKTKLFDFSFPAYKKPDLGLQTLGIRTAAIPLQLFHRTRLSGSEMVLPAEISLREAVEYSNSFLTFGFSNRSFKVELEDTQLVGEIYSLVYFPFWVLEVDAKSRIGLLIIDGVANRIRRTLREQDITSFFEGHLSDESEIGFGHLQLIPFACPVCGWDLPFSPASKTHICSTCTRAWTEKAGGYQEVKYRMLAAPDQFEHNVRYMPFWEMKTQIQTGDEVLSTRSDLCKLVPALNMGRGKGNGSSSIRFLIPAFRIRDIKSLSKLATLFCSNPPKQSFRAKERLEKEIFESVYLAGEEAKEMARVVLISMVPRYHRRARKLLKDVTIKAAVPRLVYYPFYRKGLYFREANSNYAIQHGTVVLMAD